VQKKESLKRPWGNKKGGLSSIEGGGGQECDGVAPPSEDKKKRKSNLVKPINWRGGVRSLKTKKKLKGEIE